MYWINEALTIRAGEHIGQEAANDIAQKKNAGKQTHSNRGGVG